MSARGVAIHPVKRNVILGLLEVSSIASLVSLVGLLYATRAFSIVPAFAVAAVPQLASAVVIVRRYVPMAVVVGEHDISYRNAWRQGTLARDEITEVRPTQVYNGYEIPVVKTRSGRRTRLRGASFDDFVAAVYGIAPDDY